MPTVTMSPVSSPTYRVGPKHGFKAEALIETPDLHVTDDLLVDGDMEVTGTLYCTLLSSGVTISSSNHLTADITVDAGIDITAASGTENIDYTSSTGTFISPSGENTLQGNVTISGAKTLTTGTGAIALNGNMTIAATKGITKTTGAGNFDFSAGSGTFLTSAGANTLSGDVTIANGKNLTMGTTGAFTTGSGTTTIAGVMNVADTFTLAANKAFVMGSSGSGSGTIQTGTGDITLNGNVAQTSTKTFGTGTGAVSLNGDVTVAAGKNLTMTTTGAFTSGTGSVALNGSTTVATLKTLAVTDADALTIGGVITPQYKYITLPISATESAVNKYIWIADRNMELVTAKVVYDVVTTSACTLDIKKHTSVEALTAGTTMLDGTTFDLTATARTVYAVAPSATQGNRRVASGNTVSVNFSAATTGLVGGILVLKLMNV